jgi:hypothetical protein
MALAGHERKHMQERTNAELLAVLGGAWGFERRQEAALILGARVASLEAALKPFAEIARVYLDEMGAARKPDDTRLFGANDAHFTVGDCRAALKALEDK